MNKGTFFEEFFTKSNSDCKQDNGWSSSSSEDNDIGTRTLTFGIKKDENKTTYDTDSISSREFQDIEQNSDDGAENDEIKQILQENEPTVDTNVYIDWKYNPDNIKDSEWEFAYKILTTMKLKEHFVKNNWIWDQCQDIEDDFTNTLNGSILYSLVTLVNPVTLKLEVYKVVCKIPKKQARKMYKLNLSMPSHDWVLRSRWSWLSCVPYKNDNEATV